MFHLIRPLVAGALVAVTLPALADEVPTAGTVVATVNDTEITLGHMLALRAGLPGQFQNLPADVLYGGILDQLIQQELLKQTMAEEMTLGGRLALENEERAIAATEELTRVSEAATSDDAVEAAYQAGYVDGPAGTEYRAAHILVTTEEEAAALVEELAGGADFAALAIEHSTGPSGPGGGELGWFSTGMMVEPFQDAVMALEVGEVSDPVETQFGWHVIQLNETREKERPSFDEVRLEIEEELRQAAVMAHIDGLMAEATVDRAAGDALAPEILDQIELLQE